MHVKGCEEGEAEENNLDHDEEEEVEEEKGGCTVRPHVAYRTLSRVCSGVLNAATHASLQKADDIAACADSKFNGLRNKTKCCFCKSNCEFDGKWRAREMRKMRESIGKIEAEFQY